MGRYNTGERWRWVRGYGRRYLVSTLGRVWSVTRVVVMKNGRVQTRKGRLLAQGDLPSKTEDTLPYKVVTLYRHGKGLTQPVHRLVAIAFLPNPENKPEVNHKDANPSNNRVDNLEWCTRQENSDHAHQMGRIDYSNRDHAKGVRNGNSKLTEDLVKEIKQRVLVSGESCLSVSKDYGVTYQTVCNIKTGRVWKHVPIPST